MERHIISYSEAARFSERVELSGGFQVQLRQRGADAGGL